MTAVIIAGGQSRRMKRDKALLEIGGKMLIERVLDAIAPLFSHIVINSNTPDAFQAWNYPVIPDVIPGKGALGGIYSGLLHGKTDYVFCVACDMPSLQPDLIRFMQSSLDGEEALVPKTPDGLHPLHAIYSKRCCTAIEGLLHNDQLKISDLFPLVRTRYLNEHVIRQFDPYLESFLNVNTLEELRTARKGFEDETGRLPMKNILL